MIRKLIAEFIGTYAIVFCGTGAIVINEQSQGAISHVGVAITFGLIVLAMIYTFGELSGAHFNPAVTVGFFIAGKFKFREVLPYVLFQVIGAFSASYTLMALFPLNLSLGSTIPSGSAMQSFILEGILTYFLMLVILQVSHGSKEIGLLAGIAVGSVILLEAMFAGPVSGASMNPARSLAPGILYGQMESLWIYLTAPFLGAMGGSLTWRVLKSTALK